MAHQPWCLGMFVQPCDAAPPSDLMHSGLQDNIIYRSGREQQCSLCRKESGVSFRCLFVPGTPQTGCRRVSRCTSTRCDQVDPHC